jgi:mono/diheme cytochrome c family protein
MRQIIKTSLAPAAVVTGFLASLSTAMAQDDAARMALGRRTAETVCAQCHQIDSKGEAGSAGAPAFEAVANIRSMTELSIKVFLQSPHASMPMLHLSPAELDGLGAYIMSLRRRP